MTGADGSFICRWTGSVDGRACNAADSCSDLWTELMDSLVPVASSSSRPTILFLGSDIPGILPGCSPTRLTGRERSVLNNPTDSTGLDQRTLRLFKNQHQNHIFLKQKNINIQEKEENNSRTPPSMHSTPPQEQESQPTGQHSSSPILKSTSPTKEQKKRKKFMPSMLSRYTQQSHSH